MAEFNNQDNDILKALEEYTKSKSVTPPANSSPVGGINPFADVVSKKKDHSLAGSETGSPSLKTGSEPSLPSQQNNNLYQTNPVGFVDSVLSKNASIDWVKRLREKKAPSMQVEGESDRSTHLMADDGNGYVFPTIIRSKNGKLHHLTEDEAYDYAKRTNSGIQLPKDQGTWFANNGYKLGTNVNNSINGEGVPFNNPQYSLPKTKNNNPVLDQGVMNNIKQQHQQLLNEIDTPNSQYYKDRAKAQAQEESQGSWSNTLPHVTHALTQMVTKPLSATAKIARDLISATSSNKTNADQPLYDSKGQRTPYGQQVDAGKQKDPLGKLILGLDGYDAATDKDEAQNSLPHTFLGNTVSGLIGIAPDLAVTALLPEERAIEGAGALQKLKAAIWNPFTKVMAAKGGLNAYSAAEQEGDTKGQSVIEGAKGTLMGAGQGAEAGALGGIAGGISSKALSKLSELGLVKDGMLTKIGVDAASDAAVFGAAPVATSLLQGKPINKDEIENGIGTGLAFGLLKAKHTIGEQAESNTHINEVLSDRQASAVNNFMNATPDAINEAYHNETPTGDLNAQAVEYAHKAHQEPDTDKKNQLAVVASAYAKMSDVKGVVETILKDKSGFVDSIENSELPDEQKQALITKINDIHKVIDPVEQNKTLIGNQIQQVDEAIKHVEPIATQATDPVQKTEAEVAVERLNKQKSELFKKLKDTINEQHDNNEKQGVEATEAEPPVQAEPEQQVEAASNSEPVSETPAGETNKEISPVRQKAIDAVTHGIITPGDENGRFDLGMSKAERERAMGDISKGIYDTAPAKRLLDKVEEFERNDDYPIIEGTGGNAVRRRGATAAEIQQHIDEAKSFELAKEQDREANNKALADLGFTHEDFEDYENHNRELNKQRSGTSANRKTPESVATDVQRAQNDNGASEAQSERSAPVQTEQNQVKEGNTDAIQEQGTGEMGVRQQNAVGEGVGRQDRPEKPAEQSERVNPNEQVESGTQKEVATDRKIKIDKQTLPQPQKLQGSEFNLAIGQLPDGKHAIVDTNSGIVVSKPYDSKWEALNAYEANRGKLTPEAIRSAVEKLKTAETDKALSIEDNTPKKEIANLSPKGKEQINKDIEHTGVTVDQIRDYERARKIPSGLPESNGEVPERVSEDVQSTEHDQSADQDENPKGEGLREQPEQSEGKAVTKEQALRDKVEAAKEQLSKSLKKNRARLNSTPLDPEVISDVVKLMKTYADLGIHKFSEVVKDWLNTFGKDNFTDEDAAALKAGYAAHVANLDPKERKSYSTLKELDDFMKSEMKVLRGQEDKATIPAYTPAKEPRLPLPKEETAEVKEPELKKKYSKLSGLRSYAIRNLEQLREFSKDIKNFDAYREVKKFATSKAQASVILKTATKKILGLVGKEGWQTMREALVESRLRGIRNRWNGYAEQMAAMTDEQVSTMFDEGKEGNMYQLLKNLSSLDNENNPADFAVSLALGGRHEEARQYLTDVFRKAADNVLSLGKFSNGKTFDEMVQDGKFTDPKMQEALEAYKSLLEKPIAESHESNEGIFSDDLGDLDTYYPLTGENSNAKARMIAKGKPFKEPSNLNNKFATGQSDNYSTEVSALADKLSAAIKTNNKATALASLKEIGLVVDVPHNAPDTEKMQVGEDLYDFVKEKVADSRTILADGKVTHTASKYVMMPKWLKSELDPIFNSTDQYDKDTAVNRAINLLTKVALGGPTEAISHSYRLLGVLTNSTPFMQEWAYRNGVIGEAGGYIANNPFVKKWTGLFKILNTDISSDKALQTIQEMSKLGLIPEKTWTKTWDREFAELAGAKASRIKIGKLDIPNFTDFSPVLYGKNSVDLKARVALYNLTKAMAPEATPEQHAKMQNELGIYTRALQSSVERKIKDSGLAPYYTFGSSVYRTAFKAVFGGSPLPIERPGFKDLFTAKGAKQGGQLARYKAAQLLTNGVIGSVASWALVYHSQTGKWPWEDESSKLGRIPFPEFAKNEQTAKFYQGEDGEWKDFNMMAVNNPIVERGMRVLGANKAYETAMLGGEKGQNVEAGATQALNTLVSPFTSSPLLQFATTAIAGSAPYITSLRDDKGKPAPQFFKKVKATESGVQPVANVYSAFKQTNPLLDLAITHSNKYTGLEKSLFGLNSITNGDTQNEGASQLGYILNMAFPRFFVPHGNDDAKAHFIEKAQKDLDKTLSKEQDQDEN